MTVTRTYMLNEVNVHIRDGRITIESEQDETESRIVERLRREFKLASNELDVLKTQVEDSVASLENYMNDVDEVIVDLEEREC